jgi:hypothetical protein
VGLKRAWEGRSRSEEFSSVWEQSADFREAGIPVKKMVCSSACAESGAYTGSCISEFRGSFIAHSTSATFYNAIPTEFVFESAWYFPDDDDENTWFHTHPSLTRDFRYSIRLQTTKTFQYVRISIAVQFSG